MNIIADSEMMTLVSMMNVALKKTKIATPRPVATATPHALPSMEIAALITSSLATVCCRYF